jgi:hypothetical protein
MFLHYVLKLEKDETMCMVHIEPLLNIIVSEYMTNFNERVLRKKVYKYAARIMREFPQFYNSVGRFNIVEAREYINSQKPVTLNLTKCVTDLDSAQQKLRVVSHDGRELLKMALKHKTKHDMVARILDFMGNDLQLTNEKLKEDAVVVLAAGLAKNYTFFGNVNLSFDHINNKGAVALANALTLNKYLHGDVICKGNHIGDVGAIALANAFKLNGRINGNLDLSYNEIGDAGTIAVADAFTEKVEKESYEGKLFFEGNLFTDPGNLALERLAIKIGRERVVYTSMAD